MAIVSASTGAGIGGGFPCAAYKHVPMMELHPCEAVQLIVQAGAIGEGGGIFILKMGMPVKIIDMARDLIRLSGFAEQQADA